MGSDIEKCLEEMKSAKGLVLIVTNDYKECKKVPKVAVLEECHIDGQRMEETFVGTFGFARHYEKNATADRMKDLLQQVATCKYHFDIQFIVVVFSGSGCEGTLLCNDGKDIYVEEIIERLKPDNMPYASKKIVKLFFFDACREYHVMERAKAKGYQPHPGEYLIAYSTYPGGLAYTRKDGQGSEWMPEVAQSLRDEKELSVHDAIAIVNEKPGGRQCPKIESTGSCGAIKLHEVILGKQNLS